MTTGKIALITGSNGGLGQALVDRFLAEGYFVFAGVKDLSMDTVTRPNCMTVQLDITSDADIEHCHREIAKVGQLTVLVNNAGVSGWGSFWKRELADEQAIFDVNLWGTVRMIRSFWEDLEANHGLIVNIGSIS
jgi:NAD(P)-dependent dehydrogenase (short-subunit alcohol dehydrogenase family)